MKDLKQIIWYDLFEKQRGNVQDENMLVFPGVGHTSPMATMWYTEKG